MCLVKTPKVKNDGAVDKDKPLPILRNPFLDGIEGSIRSLQIGRSALRIDRVTDSAAGVSGGGSVSGASGPGAAVSQGGGGRVPGGGGDGGGGRYFADTDFR